MGKLLRSENKKIAGVCAGLAEHFGWKNVGNVRLVWFLLAILGLGAPVLFYLILWFLLPTKTRVKKMNFEERMNRRLGR